MLVACLWCGSFPLLLIAMASAELGWHYDWPGVRNIKDRRREPVLLILICVLGLHGLGDVGEVSAGGAGGVPWLP